MALLIKRIEKPNGIITTRVISPGTIYQLFQHIKKTNRDYKLFQKSLAKKDLTPIVEERRNAWVRRNNFLMLMDD